MSSTTEQTALTTEQQALLTARDEAVAAWTVADEKTRTAVEARRASSKGTDAYKAANKEALSQGAKKANRKHDIAQRELDLRLEDVPFEPWVEPVNVHSNTRLVPMTQAEIEAKLGKLRALAATKIPDSVQHDIEIRVKALLRSAEVRGYKVA